MSNGRHALALDIASTIYNNGEDALANPTQQMDPRLSELLGPDVIAAGCISNEELRLLYDDCTTCYGTLGKWDELFTQVNPNVSLHLTAMFEM